MRFFIPGKPDMSDLRGRNNLQDSVHHTKSRSEDRYDCKFLSL
jgi:hypothetical protein